MSKHKVLDKNVLVKTEDGRIVYATAVLSVASGGKTVNYIDKDGYIVKSEHYSRSHYNTELNQISVADLDKALGLD